MYKLNNICVLAIILILLNSCNDLPTPDKHDAKVLNSLIIPTSIDSVGRIHNEIVDFYKSQYQTKINDRFYSQNGISYITMPGYQNMIHSVKDYLVNYLKYDSNIVDYGISNFENIQNQLGTFCSINSVLYYKITKNYKNIVNYLYNNQMINPETYNYVVPIYIDSFPGVSCNASTYIQNIIGSQSPTWNNIELAKYISIYNHSNDLWNDSILKLKNPNQPLPCGLNPNQAIIAADALGSLMGAYAGGLGSIIAGALMSMAEAEDQENHCSILVGSEYPESRYYIKKK
ncbi:MAG TPA: hypothetical protein PLE30_10800 [Candidatus Kapabacteria bacterium]|nr:hypothetical protein [Candidatus Kapabacteria bacterium]